MLVTVVGNRPQFIKMAPVAHEIGRRGFKTFVVHSGQHYDENMSDVFFQELSIPQPDVSLSISGRSHAQMTAEIMVKLETVFNEQHPTGVLVYGDTNTTLAAALVAVKMRIPIAHVEAGPRIYDMDTPEEVNRVFVDHVARLCFCPDAVALDNLKRENLQEGVHQTGDLMLDSFLHYLPHARANSKVLKAAGLEGQPFVLLTVHRPNNTDSDAAISGLIELCKQIHGNVLFAMHPRTKAALVRTGQLDRMSRLPNVRIVPALGYLDMMAALDGCSHVITDSGGLQKEAFFARKGATVLFHVSPWPNLVADGWLKTVGCLPDANIPEIVQSVAGFDVPKLAGSYFGDGQAARRIVDVLVRHEFL